MTRVDLSIGSLDLLQFTRYAHAFPRHSHAEFTFGVFETGNGSLGYRRAQWRAFDGSILAVSPDEVHTAEPLKGSGWSYRAMYPSVSLVTAALGWPSLEEVNGYFGAPIINDPALADRIIHVHRQLVAGLGTLEEEALLLTALRRLVLGYSSLRSPASAESPSSRAVFLARDYINAHYSKVIRLGELAREAGASPYHLVRSFTQLVGMPPHAYLTQVRTRRARELLLAGESPAGAAYLCGFCDQSHLTRHFKKLLGLTPGAYAAGARGRARDPRTESQPCSGLGQSAMNQFTA